MSCVLSFFDDAFQRELKISCMGDVAFETVIEKYRDKFLDEMDKIAELNVDIQCKNCAECLLRYPLFHDYERFLSDIVSRKNLVKEGGCGQFLGLPKRRSQVMPDTPFSLVARFI
ncbi:MAG: hypothetical protein SPL57_07785 [Lachnospiraceae bacterium]|nr:hypothetical protein [Lachnospiraceae bacterium]